MNNRLSGLFMNGSALDKSPLWGLIHGGFLFLSRPDGQQQ
jgi:hypothetical protein